MFSVYGRAGRVFQGSMEDLRKVGALSAVSRARRLAPLGLDPAEDAPRHEPVDIAHRSAMAAYAQTANPEVHRYPLTLVEHIWSRNVFTIADTASVGDAWQLLADKHLGQMPVVSEGGLLVGLVTRADLTRPDRLPGAEMHPLVWRALLAQSVVDVMWSPVPSVSPDTDIRRVARVLLDTGLPGLPVVQEEGRVTGFVSRTDILRAVVADPPLDLWS
jgi:CBS-domain-containing membrane protein